MNEKEPQDFDLQDRLTGFAVRVMDVVEALPNSRIGKHTAKKAPFALRYSLFDIPYSVADRSLFAKC